MRRLHPSPALVVSLIALFVALGGTSYAAVTSVPANSVGTAQLKNGAVTAPKIATGAVTAAKIASNALPGYLRYGGTLPSHRTEVGDWGFGTTADATAGTTARPVFSFPVPLANAIAGGHAIYVTGASATHCPGAGKADAGYLCVYQKQLLGANTPASADIGNPETATAGASTRGWTILLTASGLGSWYVFGSYAVTAP